MPEQESRATPRKVELFSSYIKDKRAKGKANYLIVTLFAKISGLMNKNISAFAVSNKDLQRRKWGL